jgi:DNA uptake protein ComE-like DNA-binding protein
MKTGLVKNSDIADALDRIADLLEAQGANRFRVAAYRSAARQVATQAVDVATLDLEEDGRQLEALPDIGKRIAALIREFVREGRMRLLERLEGETEPEDLFQTVPGIGPELSRRIHHELGIETLEELEIAAHSGQLERVPGIGPRRSEAIRDSTGALLNRSGRRRALRSRRFDAKGNEGQAAVRSVPKPSVKTLLAVDAEYRQKAASGRLRTITPRRFNPEGKSWLPIMHTETDGWHFTALYSNTARAHKMKKIGDWVVIHFDRDGTEGQSTVVTEGSGPLDGKRVVRGREQECLDYYRDAADNENPKDSNVA